MQADNLIHSQLSSRQGSLDLLRGIAILGVIYLHVAGHFLPGDSALSKVRFIGAYGVQLFFLVSAYTMCLMWVRRVGENNPVESFYIRRYFRIAPVFWLAMLGYLALYGLVPSAGAPDGVGLRQIVLTALFLHGFDPYSINVVVPGGWSIGIEMSFYALFPVLILYLNNASKCLLAAFGVWLIFGIGGAILEAGIIVNHQSNADLFRDFFYYSLFTQLPVFLLGMYIFYVLTSNRDKVNFTYLIIVVICWLGLSMVGKLYFGLNTRPFFWATLFLLSGVFIVVIKSDFRIRLIQGFGEMSYSVYLLHFAIIDAVSYVFRYVGYVNAGYVRFAISSVIVLTLSWISGSLSKATLEKWAISAGRRMLTYYVSYRNPSRNLQG